MGFEPRTTERIIVDSIIIGKLNMGNLNEDLNLLGPATLGITG